MEVIWVLENVIKSEDFYNQSRILLLAASVSLWRKYHPDHKTVFYCDKESYNKLKPLGVFDLFHDVRDLSYPEKIDRKVFWSSCKTKIISETKIPLCVVDHDFLIFTNIDEYLQDKILYSYDELDEGYYPKPECKYTTKLSTPIDRVVKYAANVSLFYLPDPEFANRYGKQTLKNHVEFTKMGIDDTNYMILSEQLMFRNWISIEKGVKLPHFDFQCLNKNLFDNNILKYTNKSHDYGIWSKEEASLYYKHYGVTEKDIDDKEREYLVRCISAGKIIKGKELKEKLDNEGYPC